MKRNRTLRRCLPLLLLALLGACGAPTTRIDEPRPTDVVAAAELSPSARPSPTASPTPRRATPTLVPTATAAPTLEPTAAPTATSTPAPTSTPTPTAEPTIDPNVSPVSGELTFARGTIGLRPWIVMIDNHPDAYPQSGLDRAALVFEGLAEYGVTRFVAVYADGISPEAEEIGPIRSTRVYFAQWAMGFHPVYVYAGGSPDGVALVQSTDQLVGFDALTELAYDWRDSRRIAPHNLYTSSAMLRKFAGDKAVQTLEDGESGYLFDLLPPADAPQATAIDYFFLDRGSRAGFRYDAASNGYHRIMRDVAHSDRVTNQQLWTRNVVVMQVSEAQRQDDLQQRIDQQVVGTGAARIFMAGHAYDATWRKDSEAGPLRFYDSSGQEVVFNAGQIWIAAIPSFDRLTVR